MKPTRLLLRLIDALAFPAYTRFFFKGSVGSEYRIGFWKKLTLMRRIRTNVRRITSATGWLEHLLLVARVLSLPRSMGGAVVECGCFRGSSTASLSLACSLTGRKLIACDSFAGLPRVESQEAIHVNPLRRRYERYREGDFCGRLETVQSNVGRYGAIECCEFVRGFFEETLGSLNVPLALIFLDVDLHASLITCVRNLWPRLLDGGYLYTHEAQQLSYVSLFFDRRWWRDEMACDAPGLIGAGSGLPVGLASSCGLGYTQKLPVGHDVVADQTYAEFRAIGSAVR